MIKKTFYYCVTVITLLFIVSCTKDDTTLTEDVTITSNIGDKISTVKHIDAQDIPEVIDFITSVSNKEMSFTINDTQHNSSNSKNHQDNLVLTTVLTDQIQQVTNSAGKSNYTFTMERVSNFTGTYFLNLVVKEYKDTFYLYIVKYVPDTNWLTSYTATTSFSSFTGSIYYYTSEGVYIASAALNNGTSTAIATRNVCDNGSGTGSTGGGGGGDSSEDPSNTDTGGNTTGSGGGSTPCTITIQDGFCHEGELDPGCEDGPSIIIIECIIESNLVDDTIPLNTHLRNPCYQDTQCHNEVGDPCSCNDSGDGCATTTEDTNEDENTDVGINVDLSLIFSLNTLLETPLTNEQIQWIFASEENEAFAEEALEALEDGAEVDFEEKIINELTGKALCVYNKLKEQNGVRDALNRFQEANAKADLRFNLDSSGEIVEVRDINGNIIGYDRAHTSFPDNNNLISISLNNVPSSNNNVNAQPNLLLGQTILHEIIHAEFFRQILDAVEQGSIVGLTNQDILNALENSEYNILYEHFRNYRNWSHTFMANYYRETIARITQEIATGIAVPEDEQPEQFYLDIAWRGLMNNNAWDGLSNTEKEQIENTIDNYVTNNANEICIN